MRSPPWLMAALCLSACGGWQSGTLHPRYSPHTRLSVRDSEELRAMSPARQGRLASVKFVITDFGTEAERVELLDGQFYRMHDEWYWYQLLNGRSLFGDAALENGPGFSTVREAEAWVREQGLGELPLSITEDRVYSEHFYRLVLAPDRPIAVGALVQVPARGLVPAYWAFELEYTDNPDAQIVASYFAALERALPASVSTGMRWLTRSPDQERLLVAMKAQGSALGARGCRYSDLATPGEVEVYNPGTAVGRLFWAEDQAELMASADPHAIIVVDRLPDALPIAAAFLSTVPQTPLSHLNILARSRGIPSLYVGGLGSDAFTAQLARAQAPVVLDVRDGQVTLSALSESEYAALLRDATADPPPTAAAALSDPSKLPYAFDLSAITAQEVEQHRQAIGGKAAGMALLARTGGDIPRPLMTLTVRSYAEHMRELEPLLVQMLQAPYFRSSREVRHLVLEGAAAHREHFGAAHAETTVQQVARRGGVLQQIVDAGGLRELIQERELPEGTQKALREALTAAFGALPTGQGLRFRSSATSEDVQGFTAAGLYESNTGFLNAKGQARAKDRKRDAEHALKRTWSSYWSFEAFEERAVAGIDHLRGRMAVVVHPRFDDARELANGVITFTLLPSGGTTRATMEVNAQLGALSVTNPPPDSQALPEVDRVTARTTDGVTEVQRVRPSTELANGEHLLSDPELNELFTRCLTVAERWLDLENSGLDAARRSRMTSLDFEFKVTRGDWPAEARDAAERRLVLKQVRSLEPAPELSVFDAMALPVPLDVARRAVQLQRRQCVLGDERVELLEVLTSSQAAPDLGFALVPFVALVSVQRAGEAVAIEHPELTQPGDGKIVRLSATSAARYGKDAIDLGAGAACSTSVEARSHAALLREIAARGKSLGRAEP